MLYQQNYDSDTVNNIRARTETWGNKRFILFTTLQHKKNDRSSAFIGVNFLNYQDQFQENVV